MTRKLSHIGIPTDKIPEQSIYMEGPKLHLTNYGYSPNNIEWIYFEKDSPMPDILKNNIHIAYEVPNLEEALEGKEVIIPPFEPFDGVKAAFIVEEGLGIELMEYHI